MKRYPKTKERPRELEGVVSKRGGEPMPSSISNCDPSALCLCSQAHTDLLAELHVTSSYW